MIIDLASLGKSPKAIEHEFDASEIELSEGTRLVGTAKFVGEARRDDVRTQVRGHISGEVERDCTRCLEPVTRAIDLDFDDVFIDAENEPTDDEIHVADADLDVSILTANRIDLGEIVREQLILATDEPVICKEDCQGLCPQCGQNRNLIDCKCESDDIDPRWAALKDLN